MNSLLQKNNPASKTVLPHGRAKLSVQPKLTINTPGDIYEQEADAMADRVMRMSSGEAIKPVTGLIGKSLQRKCAHCEEEERSKKPVMRKAESGAVGMPVSSSFASSLNASKGGGSSLPQGTRSFMENAFSTDFSEVRIHTGAQASEMSKGINAKAFTTGNDIYLNEGEYSTNTEEGKKLLAHELTHVVQQNSNLILPNRIQRQDMTFTVADTELSEARDREETDIEHSRRINAAEALQATIEILGAAIRGHFIVASRMVRGDNEYEFEINNRIFVGSRESPAHPATSERGTEGESWEERNIRLHNLIEMLQTLYRIIISQPVPERWYNIPEVGGGTTQWRDAVSYYVRYIQDSGSEQLHFINELYINSLSLLPSTSAAIGPSSPTGFNIIVPDPINHPYVYSFLRTSSIINGEIYEVMYASPNHYFYTYRSRRIYLPERPGHATR